MVRFIIINTSYYNNNWLLSGLQLQPNNININNINNICLKLFLFVFTLRGWIKYNADIFDCMIVIILNYNFYFDINVYSKY